jgi:hypothetical protein
MTERFKLDFAPAQHGGVLQAVFHDLDGYQCRLRGCDSESLTLGLVGPRDFGMMHLDRERSREISLALLGFAVSGELGDKGKAALQNLRAACERVELTDQILQAHHQQAQSFANLTMQLQGSLAAGVKLERENERLRELLRQSRHLYGRNGKESVELFEDWRRRVEAVLAPASDAETKPKEGEK